MEGVPGWGGRRERGLDLRFEISESRRLGGRRRGRVRRWGVAVQVGLLRRGDDDGVHIEAGDGDLGSGGVGLHLEIELFSARR